MPIKRLIQLNLKQALNFWLPPILWALVIFLFSSQPTTKASGIHWQDFIIKKTAHVTEYFVFTILLFRAFKNSGRTVKNALLVSAVLAIVYALTDEFHQSFTPGRDPRLRDIGFDTLGALVATFTVGKYLPKASPKIKSLSKRINLT